MTWWRKIIMILWFFCERVIIPMNHIILSVRKLGYIHVRLRGSSQRAQLTLTNHDDVIKWKHLPRYWPFVRGIHRSPVNSPHKGQWHGALMFSLICVWINGWVKNREAGDLKRYRAHYDVTVMCRPRYVALFVTNWGQINQSWIQTPMEL